MIIGKNFFIAEMPKAGSTFIRNYFKQYKDIELTIQHETINQNNRLELLEMDHRIGLIRNPYSWYLSILICLQLHKRIPKNFKVVK